MAEQIPAEKLQQLEEQVLALGSLVEGLLMEAVDVLYDSDLATLERFGDEERQVHKQRLAIEMSCLSLIATRRPLNGELRPLVAMAEIAAELEHVAEHARRMARANYLTVDQHLRKPLASLRRLANKVQSLLSMALASFAQRDVDAARSVALGSRDVEHLYQPVRNELLGVMKSRPRIANQAMYLSRSAYNLRRAAERVAGICDWVLFTAEDSPGTGGSDNLQVADDSNRKLKGSRGNEYDTSNL
ncbi:MAG: PhoU domain-containing protein [Anaerolineae bacterium]|jgi:phosphate transport system protein